MAHWRGAMAYKGCGKGQSSGGAFQPAEGPAAASQLRRLPTVRLRLGCFNCGIDQAVLTKESWLAKLRRVIGRGVTEQGLHLLTLCEVGGHQQGLASSPLESAQSLVSQVLRHHYFKAISEQAYMAAWQAEAGPKDETGVTLTLCGQPKVVQLCGAGQPQLVIMVFTIAAAGHPEKQGVLISGQLHIRTPSGKTIKTPSRKQTLHEALQHLEQHEFSVGSGSCQPIAPVMLLTGDVNLEKYDCDTVVQKAVR